MLFNWDCDVTKDIENTNKKWDTKILGMTTFLESEEERRILSHQISSLSNTVVNDTIQNLESTSKKTRHSREQTRNVQPAYRKINKLQKNWDWQPRKHRRKRYNLRLLTYQNSIWLNSRCCY